MLNHLLPPPWPFLLDEFAAFESAVVGLAAPTVGNHGTYLRAYGWWWLANRPGAHPFTSTATDVAAFLTAEAERGLVARTRRSQAAALRAFFDWLQLRGDVDRNPAAQLPSVKVPPTTPEIYHRDEVAAILAHTAELTDLRGRQRHAIVATLRYTGIRSGECRTMRHADLDLAAARVRVTGKGSRTRDVLLPAPLVEILHDHLTEVRPQLPDSPLVFVNAHPFVTTPRSGFGQEALAREVELAGLGAGVPGRHYPHRWRHTYATELARAGTDIHVVQRLMGHTSILATVGYTHLAVDDLRPAIDAVWG